MTTQKKKTLVTEDPGSVQRTHTRQTAHPLLAYLSTRHIGVHASKHSYK